MPYFLGGFKIGTNDTLQLGWTLWLCHHLYLCLALHPSSPSAWGAISREFPAVQVWTALASSGVLARSGRSISGCGRVTG